MSLKRARPIIDEVRAAVDRFAKHARTAGVGQKTLTRVARVLGVPPR